MWCANTVYKLWKFNTCVANGRIRRWKWRHEVSRVIASCAGWHDADGRMLSSSYYFESRDCRIGEQWCTCRMGRRDGHSRTYPAMFLYLQSHGLRKLYGLSGKWVNMHICDSEICSETNFTFVGPCIVNVFKHNQQDATLHNCIYYYKCSACFRRFNRPSSGAQIYIHSIMYLSSFFCFLLLSNSLTIAVRSTKRSINTRCCVYSFELLMMGGGTAWNM